MVATRSAQLAAKDKRPNQPCTPPRDPMLSRLARAFFRQYPRLKAVAFYGSRATQSAGRYSDYDVMLFLPGGLDWNERYAIGEKLGRRFGVKLEVNVASPRSVEWHYRLFPDFRFSLKEAVIFGDRRVVNGRHSLPPVAREGLRDSVIEAEIYWEKAEAHPEDTGWQAEWYFRALRKALVAATVIEGDYRQQRFRQILTELLGTPLARKMNRPSVHRPSSLPNRSTVSARSRARRSLKSGKKSPPCQRMNPTISWQTCEPENATDGRQSKKDPQSHRLSGRCGRGSHRRIQRL